MFRQVEAIAANAYNRTTMAPANSPRRRAMADYYRFSFFNVISFNFLAGNIIVLYAIRLGAGSALVGLIAAAYQVTFIFSIIGRRLVGRFGAVRLFGSFWIVRYLLMIPVLLTALPFLREQSGLSLAIVGLSAFGFNISKGIGLTAVRPITGEIPPQKERGSFLSNQQLIFQFGAILTGVTMAWLLGPQSELGRYAVLIIIGVVAGLIASYFILRLPEPEAAADSFKTPFAEGVRKALRNRSFLRFLAVHMVIMFVVTMTEAFLIVFFRSHYGYGDRAVVLFTAVGSVGAAVMAAISRAVVDRTGAKPLLFVFAGFMLLTLVAVSLFPLLPGAVSVALPALVFFFFAMGRFGTWTAADNYFYSMTPALERLDVGIVFGLGAGVAGTLGSILGGLLLSGLQSLFPSAPGIPFTIYFGLAAVITLAAMIGTTRLKDVNSIPIPAALGIFVSPRDLRAIRLLNRLRRSRTEPEEQIAVRALRDSTSALPLEELSQRIESPSLLIRMEALNALRGTPLTRKVENLLMADVRTHPFTTANLAAEILGLAGVKRAIPVLRDAVDSPDSVLSARAMLALARLNDRSSVKRFEQLLKSPPNARVAIYAVKAIELLGNVASIPLIMEVLAETEELFQRDEYILSCARILGFFDWFYEIYLEFLDDRSEALRTLKDAAASAGDEVSGFASEFISVFDAGAGESVEVVRRFVASHAQNISDEAEMILRAALLNESLLGLERFRVLLLASVIARNASAQGTSPVV